MSKEKILGGLAKYAVAPVVTWVGAEAFFHQGVGADIAGALITAATMFVFAPTAWKVKDEMFTYPIMTFAEALFHRKQTLNRTVAIFPSSRFTRLINREKT